jgi:hypothetical protein
MKNKKLLGIKYLFKNHIRFYPHFRIYTLYIYTYIGIRMQAIRIAGNILLAYYRVHSDNECNTLHSNKLKYKLHAHVLLNLG